MVENVLLRFGEIRIAQEPQCSNQLKGEGYSIPDVSFFQIVHTSYMTDPVRNGTVC